MTMNSALLYLWWALLKRRTLRFARDLRRPSKLIGFAALGGLFGFLFHFRDHEFVGKLVRRGFLAFLLQRTFRSIFAATAITWLAFAPCQYRRSRWRSRKSPCPPAFALHFRRSESPP